MEWAAPHARSPALSRSLERNSAASGSPLLPSWRFLARFFRIISRIQFVAQEMLRVPPASPPRPCAHDGSKTTMNCCRHATCSCAPSATMPIGRYFWRNLCPASSHRSLANLIARGRPTGRFPARLVPRVELLDYDADARTVALYLSRSSGALEGPVTAALSPR